MDAIHDDASDQIKALYGRHGVKAQGKKHTPHLFHTILLFAETKTAGWTMTSVKDRERELLKGTEVGNFAMPYLVGEAGWTP